VYYSSQVLLIGAEFTEVYARLYGSRITPDDQATFIEHPKEDPKAPSVPLKSEVRSSADVHDAAE
jgi:membrane protein